MQSPSVSVEAMLSASGWTLPTFFADISLVSQAEIWALRQAYANLYFTAPSFSPARYQQEAHRLKTRLEAIYYRLPPAPESAPSAKRRTISMALGYEERR